MRSSRRMRRMGRNRKITTGLLLTSLMDIFTILVFFLLFHSSGSDVQEPPRDIHLPESVIESKPRETVRDHCQPRIGHSSGQGRDRYPRTAGCRV